MSTTVDRDHELRDQIIALADKIEQADDRVEQAKHELSEVIRRQRKLVADIVRAISAD